ncbi:tetratricopeptide repeat protein [Cryomorpha ignava]|uniref:Tetratricopeptide repeat protein n=1 Tax=Cryomorpha ignava TaxID=101383 RepID=A0A7K3WMQ0_9FLAO|nr:tetratricopeptide repeat protein [Cryomorpha ignava]NEN22916.1 tetratricopeptide repeat protein [Cryomorpha ignava]
MIRFAFIFSFFILCGQVDVQAQQGTTDEQLAGYYLDTGEYQKALLYYEKLYGENPKASNYEGLLTCYTKLENYKEAEKLVKKQLKKFSSNTYYIDLGTIYEAQGKESDANSAYRDAITNLPESQGLVIRTANEFIRRNKLDLALETYQYGKKILAGRYPFSYEIAGLYGSMGDTQKMISEYLDLIEFNEAYLQTVQNALGRSIDFESSTENVDLLRNELLRRVQKDPASTTYGEMLTWLFLQQRDFNSAFVQLKAIDKRLNEDGARILNLANLCTNNQEYNVAEKCYNYLIEKGAANKYYNYARAGVLKSRFEKLRTVYPPDTMALKTLRKDYTSTLNELGSVYETVGMLRQKAQLEAYYLDNLEGANVTLNEALDTPALYPEVAAEIKLELARILIARDYIWDASLLSSQVDKDFKNDMLGYEAKLLNAKISYYTGDFDWAQAQLDILKGSTSKLISNDAMELSLLITDNMNMDTIYEPMILFANADLLTVQHKFPEAIVILDSILTTWPGHALTDEILLQRAKIAEEKYDYEEAITFYQRIIIEYYFGISADNALFRMADLYENKLKDPEKAQEYYKQLMVDFPGSLYVVEARKRFRAIRGDAPNQEIREITPDSKVN